MALRAIPECDLPRQDFGAYQEDGGKAVDPSHRVPRSPCATRIRSVKLREFVGYQFVEKLVVLLKWHIQYFGFVKGVSPN